MLLNPSLQLPEENEFIPTDFSIRERPQDVSTVKYSILYVIRFGTVSKAAGFQSL